MLRDFSFTSKALNAKDGDAIVKGYLNEMRNNKFDPRHAVGGYRTREGLVLDEGNHKMNAAIQYAIETKDNKYVTQLLSNSRLTNTETISNYGLKAYKLPTLK
ncbi:MAG: hypothetical protein ABW007_06975 [Chitinophagaceae bacterium]